MSPETAISVTAGQESGPEPDTQARLIALGARYRHLRAFPPELPDLAGMLLRVGTLPKGCGWGVPKPIPGAGAEPGLDQSPPASIRRLAREMAANQMLDSAVAAAIERVPGGARHGTRLVQLVDQGAGQ